MSLQCRYLSSTSSVAYINARLVEGSGFGPPSYIVVASDLHPKHECNVIVKFANDTYLLVGSNHLSTATEEFENISAWAMENNFRLNSNKTRELIVVRKGRKSITCPPIIIPGASRVISIRVLGATISSDLGMGQHLDEVLTTCASSMYALRVLHSHVLPPSAIHGVARMTTVSSLMYASPEW